MCMRGSESECVLAQQQSDLQAKVLEMDKRLTKVEQDLGTMRIEFQDGFKQGAAAMQLISVSVTNLAHDFGSRMNNFDKRIIEEKEKWGATLRTIILWSAKVLLVGALVAMGINLWKQATGS